MLHKKKDCQSFWVLRVTVGTRQDWNMVIAKTRAENKWEKKKEFFLLSDRGRSEAQVYDIHACYSVLFTVYTGDRCLFLDIQFIALLSDKKRR